MPRRTTADTMAQGGRHTRGHPRDEGVLTGGRRSGGNCGGNASKRAAGEYLGEDGPDRWAPSISDGDAVRGWLRTWEWAGVGAKLGRPQRKRPTMIFFHFKLFSN
jgi:hypothetical protein